MFKTQAQIDEIVVDAKAYLYQSTQTIAAELQIQILLEHVEFASLISSDAAAIANARSNQIREAVELLEEHQQANGK